MKNIAILVDGKINLVADWPEKQISLKEYEELGICQSIEIGEELKKEYQKEVKQALANAIPFKNIEDEVLVKEAIYHNELQGHMEQLKPYDVPEGIEISFMCDRDCQADVGDCCHPSNCVKRAFIVRQPKEESQEDMIREIVATMVENLNTSTIGFETVKSKFRIERIKTKTN